MKNYRCEDCLNNNIPTTRCCKCFDGSEYKLDYSSRYHRRHEGDAFDAIRYAIEDAKVVYGTYTNMILNSQPPIEKVIFHDPATIVYWKDGNKTVVKAENEPFDPEKGLAMAISKYFLGNEGNYYETFKKWLPVEETDVSEEEENETEPVVEIEEEKSVLEHCENCKYCLGLSNYTEHCICCVDYSKYEPKEEGPSVSSED